MQDSLHPLCLFILHVQDDLGLAVIDDTLAVLPVIQSKEVVQILCGKDAGSGVSPDDLGNLQYEFRCKPVAGCTDELPDLIDKDGFLFGTVFLRFIPDIIQGNEHADR